MEVNERVAVAIEHKEVGYLERVGGRSLDDNLRLGHQRLSEELPSFATYLTAKYPELSAKTQRQLVQYFQVLTGINLDMVTVNAEPQHDRDPGAGIDRPTA